MSDLSVDKTAQFIYDLDLVSASDLREVRSAGNLATPADLVQALIRRELLTNYQAERILKGERTGYYYGSYRVLYQVGAGTFARVFRAVDKYSGEVRAVKVLRRRFSEDPEKASRFFQEGQLGQRLRHPNIVPIYEVHSEGPVHFLVMEFVEGHNLRDFLKIRKKLDPLEASRLVRDIASGLQYALDLGLCHRDLKLSNVLITTRGQAKLVDFGLAGGGADMTDAELARQLNPRTVDYAGLEKATGAPKDDPRSDLFFLGCMYYHLLTGQSPLSESKNRVQRMARSRFEDIAPVGRVDGSLPDAVCNVVQQAITLDPRRRYQSPGAVVADLDRVIEHLAASQRVSGAQGDSRRVAPGRAAEPAVKATLMFVESNHRLQDVMRQGLRRDGFRVLVTSDPRRALERFHNSFADVPDAIVFSAQEIGPAALEAFNEFATDERTQDLPAMLLLREDQRDLADRAQLSDRRAVLTLPLHFNTFRQELARVLAAAQRR